MGTIFEVDWRTGIAVDRSLYGFVAFVLERLLGFDGSIGNTHERLQLFVSPELSSWTVLSGIIVYQLVSDMCKDSATWSGPYIPCLLGLRGWPISAALPSPRLEKWRRCGCCEADDIPVQVSEVRSRLAL